MSLRFWFTIGVLLLMYSFFLSLVAHGGQKNTEFFINKLGSKNYSDRQDAQKRLKEAINFNLYLELSKIKSENLEVLERIKVIKEHYKSKINFQIYKKLKKDVRAVDLVRSYESRLRNYYCVDLRGHHRYPWLWTNMGELDTYLRKARKITVWGRPPHYIDYHLATAIWLEDKINIAFRECIDISNSEMEFRCLMFCRMSKIQKQIDEMISRDYGLKK